MITDAGHEHLATVRTITREQIAANVRVALARRNVDQATLGAALGKSQPAISDRLRAVTHFRVDELQIVAHLAGVDFAELVEPPAGDPNEPTA